MRGSERTGRGKTGGWGENTVGSHIAVCMHVRGKDKRLKEAGVHA